VDGIPKAIIPVKPSSVKEDLIEKLTKISHEDDIWLMNAISKDSILDRDGNGRPDTYLDKNGDGISKDVLLNAGFTKIFTLPPRDVAQFGYSAMGRVGDYVVAFTNTRGTIYLDPVMISDEVMVIVNLRTGQRIRIPLGGSQPDTLPPTSPTTTSAPPPTIQDAPPQMSCSEWCSSKGYSASPVDHSSYIGSYLNNYQCVSGVSVQLPEPRLIS